MMTALRVIFFVFSKYCIFRINEIDRFINKTLEEFIFEV